MEAFARRGNQIISENASRPVSEPELSERDAALAALSEKDFDGVFAGTNVALRSASMLLSRFWGGGSDENASGPENGAALFSTTALVSKARASACVPGSSGSEVPLKAFISVMREIAKVFDVLGTAFSFVKEDITVKAEILERMQSASRGVFKTIQDLCRWEIQKDIISKRDSGTWHAVRLIWLLEFMEVFSVELSTTTKSLQECATQAYNASLSMHHPFPIRAAVGVALGRLPAREKFCELIKTDVKKAVGDLKEFSCIVEPIRASLKRFHRENDLARLE
eukprot:tig00020592_g11686.t1